MSGTVAHIWRHPLKSHGREALSQVYLEQGRPLPWDRLWAVAHKAAKITADNPSWVECVNFSRGAKAPLICAISARLDEGTARLTLSHPQRPDITFSPDDAGDAARFIKWVTPISPKDRAQPAQIVSMPNRGFTDTDYPSISLNSLSTLQEISAKAGQALSPERWRGNIWLDKLPPWQEFDWIGKTLRIGTVEFEVKEPITRCLTTATNPRTGQRDVDTLGLLQHHWGHKDFGVYAVVVKSGTLEINDKIEVL